MKIPNVTFKAINGTRTLQDLFPYNSLRYIYNKTANTRGYRIVFLDKYPKSFGTICIESVKRFQNASDISDLQ